jgi:hypothetical protein
MPATPAPAHGLKGAFAKLGRKPKLLLLGVAGAIGIALLLRHGKAAAGSSDAQTAQQQADQANGNLGNAGWSDGSLAGYPGAGSTGGPSTLPGTTSDLGSVSQAPVATMPTDPGYGYSPGFDPYAGYDPGAFPGAFDPGAQPNPAAGPAPAPAAGPKPSPIVRKTGPRMIGPPVYRGGAQVTKVEHTKGGATITTLASGVRIEQAPGKTPYRISGGNQPRPLPPARKASTPPARPSPVNHAPAPAPVRVAPPPHKGSPVGAYRGRH